MKANKLIGILAAAFIATQANASVIVANGYDEPAGTPVSVNVNGTEHASLWAGPFLIAVDGGPAIFDVFCLDFFTSIDNTATYNVTISAPSASLYQLAGQMYSSHIADMNGATGAQRKLYGAALQIALWEVVIDGFNLGTTNDLATGLFRESTITPFSAQLKTIVDSYLTAALGPVAPGTFIYRSSSPNVAMQDLIGGGPSTDTVPEPSTWAMLGTGIAALSLLRRRR
jgi:PEP-CTERM motif